MPLIVITGLPCSGKSHRARQIFEDLKSRIGSESLKREKGSVILLPSHHAHLDPPYESTSTYTPPAQDLNPRDQIYNLSSAEKRARAEEFSAIKRAISKHAIVIADAPNYIKGFRYQLWCEAKAAGTRCIVVHAAAREDECRAWNIQRLEAWGWDAKEEEEKAEEEERVKRMGPKIGRDVMGDLTPESHTALYGDKIIDGGTSRSRSSSMGAVNSDDDEDEDAEQQSIRRQRADDTMTLKSLYINAVEPDTTPSKPAQPDTFTQPNQHTPTTSAPAIPPSPTSSLPYTLQTLTSLTMRYEPPSPFTRWDTPLFTVPSSDTHPPYTAIWEAMFPGPAAPSKKARAQASRSNGTEAEVPAGEVKQHAATVLPAASGANALQMLEHCTGDCVKAILSSAREAGLMDAGGQITFSVESGEADGRSVQATLDVPTGLTLSQPMLQRLRRKYTQIQRGGIAHGQGHVKGRREIVDGFVRFLGREWESD